MIKGFLILILDGFVSYAAGKMAESLAGQQMPAVPLIVFVVIGGFLLVLLKDERELVLTWIFHRFRFLFDLKKYYSRLLETKAGISTPAKYLIENKAWVQIKVNELQSDFVELLYNKVLNEKKPKHILIIGDPGTGKTFALIKTAYSLTKFSIYQLGFGVPIPILVRCDEYKDSLLNTIQGKLPTISNGESGKVLGKGAETLLKRGHILLLLDALDETPVEYKQQLVHEIEEWVTTRGYAKVSIIITARSREIDISSFESWGFQIAEVQELSDDSVDYFVELYKRTEQNADDVITSLEKLELLKPNEVGRNPFWLSLMIREDIFNKDQEIVLDKSISRLLETEWKKGKEKLRWNKKTPMEAQISETRRLLGVLAYEMISAGAASLEFNAAKTILEAHTKDNNPLELTAFDVFGFSQDSQILESTRFYQGATSSVRFRHELLKEFLCASQMLSSESFFDQTHLNIYMDAPSRWWSVILLSISLLQNGSSPWFKLRKATSILQKLADINSKRSTIFVAATMSPLDRRINSELSKSILEKYTQILNNELSDDVFEIIKLFLKIAPDELLDSLSYLVETSHNPINLKQVILYMLQSEISSGQKTKAFTLVLNAWRLRELVIDSLTQIGSAATNLLLESLEPETTKEGISWLNTLTPISALGRIKDNRAVVPLCKVLTEIDNDYKSYVITALAQIGDPSAIPSLIEALRGKRDESENEFLVKPNIYSALGNLGEEGLQAIMKELENESEVMAELYGVDRILANAGQSGISLLKQGLQSQKRTVRQISLKALTLMKDESAIVDIANLLDQGDILLGTDAAKSLGSFGTSGAGHLINAMGDDKDFNQRFSNSYIVKSLVEIGEPAAGELIKSLDSQHEYVIKNSAIALGRIGGLGAKDKLLNLIMRDFTLETRIELGIALGRLAWEDENIEDRLIEIARGAKNWFWMLPPMLGLVAYGNDSTTEIILEQLKNGFEFDEQMEKKPKKWQVILAKLFPKLFRINGSDNTTKPDTVLRLFICSALREIAEYQNVENVENFVDTMEMFLKQLQSSNNRQDRNMVKTVNTFINGIKSANKDKYPDIEESI